MREETTRSEEETEALATRVGKTLSGGEVVLLTGDLGAGKTAFVRGLARGIGVDPAEVASPTFVLLTSYPGRLTLHHADLYRLAGGGDDGELGLGELPGPKAVLAVEWAERLSSTPWIRTIEVMLEHLGENERRIRVEEQEK
jgi:tRNA threonylcarbamoyladenosine biosynthesis protein TsaE